MKMLLHWQHTGLLTTSPSRYKKSKMLSAVGGSAQISEHVSRWRAEQDDRNAVIAKAIGTETPFVRALSEEIGRLVDLATITERGRIESLKEEVEDLKSVIHELESDREQALALVNQSEEAVKASEAAYKQLEKSTKEVVKKAEDDAREEIKDYKSEKDIEIMMK